ncbi:MAG: LysM peptidoglycan-binding domain-containing protein [Ardenticatenaceae bacterium]|nr:LysM peptidoglycan-binding domain-containing protein [Ardenticatenaceae bacterium]
MIRTRWFSPSTQLRPLPLSGGRLGWGILLPFLIFCLWLAGGTAVSAQNPTDEILNLVNAHRASYGLPAFQYNGQLANAAQNHAAWMAQTGIYSHFQTNGSSPQSRANAAGYVGNVSENIVGGTHLSAREGVLWWQNSGVHNQTMLSSRYSQAGVGYALSADGQRMYVLVVGQPSDQPPSNQPPETHAAPIYVEPIEIAAPREDGAIVHVVKTGQTAWAIAARYDIPLSELLYLNSLGNSPTLNIGDEIYIRLAEGQAPPPTPTPPLSHIVQEGQTLWTIAAIYDIELSTLLYYNNLGPEDILQPGDEVRIYWPEGEPLPPTPTPQMAHIVREGDTGWSVALRYGLTLEQLLAYNNLAADAVLHIGDELWIRPTFTPIATPITPTAEATATAVPPTREPLAIAAILLPTATTTPLAPRPSPLPTPLSPLPTATPANSLSQTLYRGSMIASVGLLVAAGIIILVMRKNNLV